MYHQVALCCFSLLVCFREIRQFESQSFFITNVIGLLLEQDLKDVIPPVLLTFTFNTASIYVKYNW